MKLEGADGVVVHVIGGEIDLAWVRDFSQAHERARLDKVAESLLRYGDLGVTTLLIRGFAPPNDAAEYRVELIPLIRAGVARRDRPHAVGSAVATRRRGVQPTTGGRWPRRAA